MKAFIRRIFAADVGKYKSRSTRSTQSSSQEYLLADSLLEKKTYLSGDKTDPYDDAPVKYCRGAQLPSLPQKVISRISGFLDEVSVLCLKNTSTHLRDVIKIDESQVSQCARWRMLCFLESDLRNEGSYLPSHLACRYCKRAHPREEFGVRDGNVGYGIERLRLIELSRPEARECWRSIPKKLVYTPGTESLGTSTTHPPNKGDKWVVVRVPVCVHCCERSSRHENGSLECQVCKQECKVCGFSIGLNFERHGPERPLEDYANIRFVRRFCNDFRLEMQDLNGIRDPRRRPGQEHKNKIWRERSLIAEFWQYVHIERALVPKNQRRFSLYSDIHISKDIRPMPRKIGVPNSG